MGFLGQHQFRIFVTLDGVPIPHPFSTRSGGETTWEEIRFRPGGMEREVVKVGPRSVGNVTITRPFREPDDRLLLATYAERNGVRVGIADQHLDDNGVPFGTPLPPQSGVLISISRPESDADGSDKAMLEMEVAIGAAG